MLEELRKRLEELGYRWSGYYRGEVETYSFTMETDTIHFAPYLPMERINRGLSSFRNVKVKGFYLANLTVEDGQLRLVEYSFSYHLKANGEQAYAYVKIYGPMDAPFPEGRPTKYDIYAQITISGPEPMGKGQKTRARQKVKEVLASLPELVEAFPDAQVYVELETRGGRGGWKAKTAKHEVGRVRDWMEVMR
jgi:hypothetical protein